MAKHKGRPPADTDVPADLPPADRTGPADEFENDPMPAPGAADPVNGSPPPGGVEPPPFAPGAHGTHATSRRDVRTDGSAAADTPLDGEGDDGSPKVNDADDETAEEAKERAERIDRLQKELSALKSGTPVSAAGQCWEVRCEDPGLRPRKVVASTEADAWAKYLRYAGATGSTFAHTVTPCDGPADPIPKPVPFAKRRPRRPGEE